MARKSAEARDANLAACLITLVMLTEESLTNPQSDRQAILNQLAAIKEIAFQCVTGNQVQECQQSIAAILTYVPMPAGSEPQAIPEATVQPPVIGEAHTEIANGEKLPQLQSTQEQQEADTEDYLDIPEFSL